MQGVTFYMTILTPPLELELSRLYKSLFYLILLTTYQYARRHNPRTPHFHTCDKVPCPVLSPSLPVTQLQVFQMLLQWCGLHCRRRSKSTASGLRNPFLFCFGSGRLCELWPHFITLELGLFSFALRCCLLGHYR